MVTIGAQKSSRQPGGDGEPVETLKVLPSLIQWRNSKHLSVCYDRPRNAMDDEEERRQEEEKIRADEHRGTEPTPREHRKSEETETEQQGRSK